MQAASLVRDERATPLFAYMLRHVDHRRLTSTYLHALESLGTLKDPEAVRPPEGSALQGRVVGAATDRFASECGRAGTRAHRHAGGPNRARRSGRARSARDTGRRTHAAGAGATRTEGGPAMTATPRFQLADELLRRLAAAMRSSQLYTPGHPIITRNLASLSAAMQLLHGLERTIVIGIVGNEVIVDDTPVAKADALGTLVRRLQHVGIERISIDRGVTPEEIAELDSRRQYARARATTWRNRSSSRRSLTSESVASPSISASKATSRTWRRSGVSTAAPWTSPRTSGIARRQRANPTPRVARTMIDGLAQAVARKPHRAARAHDAQELRQLHVHAHGERLDPDDGPGGGHGHRRRAAAGVRSGGADARHRQGQNAARDPEQARQADGR